jgi:uncharacterized membrane protein YdcZ (DUF606 family)
MQKKLAKSRLKNKEQLKSKFALAAPAASATPTIPTVPAAPTAPTIEKKFLTAKPVHSVPPSSPISPASPASLALPISPASEASKPIKSEKTYKSALPTLLVGVFFLTILAILMAVVQPYSVANIPLQNMFLPILTPLFLGVFFVASYVFLNSRIGIFVACTLTCIAWTQLVMPNFTFFVCLGLLAWYGGLAFLLHKKS